VRVDVCVRWIRRQAASRERSGSGRINGACHSSGLCVCVYVCVCTCVCMCVCLHVCACVCVHMYIVCACVGVYGS